MKKKLLLSSMLGALCFTTAHAAVGSIPKDNLKNDMDLFMPDNYENHSFYGSVAKLSTSYQSMIEYSNY